MSGADRLLAALLVGLVALGAWLGAWVAVFVCAAALVIVVLASRSGR